MASIRVEPSIVAFPNTYILATSRFTFTIYNDGNEKAVVNFLKYQFSSEEKEELDKIDSHDPNMRREYQMAPYFKSEIFSFENQEIEIWPSKSKQVTAEFVPQIAQTYTETLYIGVSGKDDRIPLTLRGTGLPPDASFNVDSINIGHVTLDSILNYKVVLRNSGQVGVDFELEEKDRSPQIFSFSPTKGHINIGEEIEVAISFIANSVGSFSEEFKFLIKGATQNHPILTLYGRVIGPTFVVNTKNIVFGTVSYGFLYSQSFEIENKSEIPFEYNIELAHDGSFARREFSVTPFAGLIGKFAKQVIRVDFIPTTVQEYKVFMYLNVAKFGQKLYKIPISATCICPDISLVSNVVDLGSIFIGYKYKGTIQLVDDTDFPCKFEYVEASDSSKLQAVVEIPKPIGVTKPHSTTDFVFSITANQLGPLNIVQYLKINGNEKPPIPFTIKGICTGPSLNISTQQLMFRQIHVLKPYEQTITITNNSTIKAVYRNTVQCENKVFTLSHYNGEIPPGESLALVVTAVLDDPASFKGTIQLLFDNLTPITIPVVATGTGTAIQPSIDMSTIDFGCMFADRPNDLRFTLTNRGRKSQEIKFSQTKPKIDDKANFSFKITPDQTTIQSQESVEFKFTVMCNKTTNFYIDLQIHTQIGKARHDLFKPRLKGVFIKPSLTFSKQLLEFKHVHDSENEEKILNEEGSLVPSQELLTSVSNDFIITNTSKLPLSLILDCPEPFSISENMFRLDTQQSKDLRVIFDPKFKTDFISETVNRKLIVALEGLPQKFNVNLKGMIVFPNLEFTPSGSIDFGSMLMNTEQTKDIELKNPTDLPVNLTWELLPSKTLPQDISSIFDIYPTRATIAPHSSDATHVSFYAKGNPKSANAYYEGIAVCHIEGGPEYTIPIKGGSANIMYQIEPNNISFGQQNYLTPLSSTINFTNTCDVPINYTIKIPKACKFNSISFTPPEGQLAAGQALKIEMNILTGSPIQYNEQFFIQIGHFEEFRIDVEADCYIPHLFFDLPRNEKDPVIDVFKSRRSHKEYQNLEETPENLAKIETELLINQLMQAQISSVRRKRRQEQGHEYEGFVLRRYDLDLGKIVFGKKETFTLKAKSMSKFPLSFDIDTRSLNGTGFTIETSSFANIPPDEEIDIPINFTTAKRTNNILGDVVIQLPFIMNEDFAIIVNLKANLQMPVINFSKTHFDFGNVIVGQSLILTLQLQNMNSVPCEFNFGPAEFVNVLQRGIQQGTAPPFTAFPSCGVLPPSSFMNIEIAFSPRNEKSYSMQFPIEVKHNSKPFLVTLKGTGVQLKVVFDPPDLKMPPVMPFSEPSEAKVKLMNPTQYPIEVMALQFDLQLLIDSIENPRIPNVPSIVSEASMANISFTNQNSSVSKFSICVIVNGANSSGKTTASKAISQYLNVPIINLAEVWKEIIANPSATQADYVEALQELIHQPEYFNGFVIDGLRGLPEPPETDTFLSHCIKPKNAIDDALKNPFNTYPHPTLTSTEQALSYVLASLDGHYVFHVGLRASEEEMEARKEEELKLAAQEKKQQMQQEKEMLFNMTEEEYEKLSPEKQEEIDAKRQAFRRRLIRSALDSIPDDLSDRSSRSKGHKHKHHSSKDKKDKKDKKEDKKDDKKDKKDDKKDKKEEKKERKVEEEKKEETPKKKKGGLPTDPFQLSNLQFIFTFGNIAQRLRETAENFTCVDPVAMLQNDKPETPVVSEEEEEKKDPNTTDQAEQAEETADESTQEVPINRYTNMNSILVDVINQSERVNKEILNFIPQPNQLKNKAFTVLIPAPRLVLPDPRSYKHKTLQQMPKYFSIVIEEEAQEEIRVFLDSRPNTQQKGRKSRINKNRDSALFLDADISKNTPRWRIEANSEKLLTISFNPEFIGSYSDTLIFALANGKSDLFRLPVTGECLYPNFNRDPKTLWTKAIQKYEPKCEPAFIIDTNEYNFGYLLVSKDKAAKGSAAYHGTVNIKNITPFPTEITANIIDHSGKGVYSIDSPSFVVQPAETFPFNFGFHPTIPENYKATVEFFVKDHPEPMSFNITADACIPIIELSGTNLDFEKQLLSQSKTLRIDMKNTGKLPACWRLKNVQQVNEFITFNQTEGTINPKGSFSIVSTFSSAKPYAIKKGIVLEVLDKDKARVFQTNQIQVAAESFDVNVDFQYPKGMDHLLYGPMKVSQPKTLSCTLTNKGRYTSGFKVAVAPEVAGYFEVSPQEGQIPSGNKSIQINFTFMSSKIVSFNTTKGIVVKLTDALTNTNTGELPISFTASTLYSTYKIDPQRKLDFGPIQVNISDTKSFTITNTGVFPFDYDIQGKAEDPAKAQQAKKLPKGAKPPPKPKRKGNEKTITIGPYTLGPSSGQILPNSSASIDIDFVSGVAGSFNSTALISITDTNPNHNSGGIPFQLNAAAYVPGIITTQYEKIFPGLPLCLGFERQKITKNTFIEDEQTLYFTPIVLQTKSSVTFDLVNPLPIPCQVDLSIKAKQKTAGPFPFDISEKTVSIKPESSQTIQMTFAPSQCDKYIAILEANVRSSTEPDMKTLKFTVEGTGTLPTISPVGFERTGKSSNFPVNLGKTLIGFKKEKDLFLKNDGLIPTKIMISAKSTPDFELVDIDSVTEFVIEPGRQFQMKAVFNPQKVRKGTFEISVAVVDNPKANISFSLTAEGFSEDVVFEGVRGEDELVFRDNVVGRQQTATFIMRNVSTNDIKFNWGTHPDFTFSPKVGHLRINQMKEITVTFFSDKPTKYNALKIPCQWTKIILSNPSSADWDDSMKVLKYVPKSSLQINIPPPQQVEETPTKTGKKGRQPSRASKDKHNDKNHHQQLIPPSTSAQQTTQQQQTQQQQQQPEQPSSDEPDVLVRVVDVKPEPQNSPIAGKYKELVIKVFAISDYIRYVCDTTDIAFASTMMYQTRTSECKISNPTQIRFEYVWKIMNFKSLRSDYLTSKGYPFHIMPESGFIEPGQTTTFKIQFVPEEVDDFTAQLTCQIPFISQMEPPVINISGLSRRPLCHFNIKMSDYISAGRRHPDYTYELPPDTHVIEVFAHKTGQKTNIRFDIINPTGTPYEMIWKRMPEPDAAISSAVTCETPAALISSGKRYFVNFTFTPTSQKLVESLWEFSIPEHNATAYLLIVGRIV